MIIKAPLDSGMLGGTLTPDRPVGESDPRARWGEEGTAPCLKTMEAMRFIADGTGRTWSQAALHFILSYGAVSTVIPGTTSIPHLEENAAAAGGRLSHDEVRRLHGLMGGGFAELNLGW